MGTVHLTYTRGGQPVALKPVRREYAQSAAFRERFAREVAAARRVAGPHLVPVLDHDAEAALPWLATRYVPGVPLDEGPHTVRSRWPRSCSSWRARRGRWPRCTPRA
ncbi:hypothetical protein ACIBUY_19535 [Streptomyces sp. NPDC050085]|uniref:hypothetical protein n=1 Tax=Streptomyces sp. NPDC050085 TaxID=3365600 RepID=UPI0037A4F9EB